MNRGILYAMSSLELVDLVGEDPYSAHTLSSYLLNLYLLFFTYFTCMLLPHCVQCIVALARDNRSPPNRAICHGKLSTNLTYTFHYAMPNCNIPMKCWENTSTRSCTYSITVAEGLHGQFGPSRLTSSSILANHQVVYRNLDITSCPS
jgi:hypothetical protein